MGRAEGEEPSMGLIGTIRQWVFPREFRIADSAWPAGLPELLRELAAARAAPEPPPAPRPSAQPEPRLLAEIGTGLWRLRQKMLQPGSDRPLDEMRRAYRHLESVWDALAQAGIEIRDHTGEPVPEGGIYALKVIAFQPTPGLARDRVLETIKPSIYANGEMIQMGEVIVGTPETPGDDATAGRGQAAAATPQGGETHG